MSPAEPAAQEILIAVADPDLAQEAAAVAAAGGYAALAEPEPDPAGAAWRRAAAILLDVGAAAGVADRGPGIRRERVFLVHADGADPDLRAALAAGAEDALALPAEGAELVRRLGRPGPPAAGAGVALACIGAVGGAGASVLAAACALHCAESAPTALIDADELSGGADLLLGVEHLPGLRWPELRAGEGRMESAPLLAALPGHDWSTGGPAVLTGPRSRDGADWAVAPAALAAVVDALLADGGAAVVDLPRTGAVVEVAAARADLVVVAVPPTVRGVAAAARQARRLRGLGADPAAVLCGPAPGGVAAADVEYATGLPVLARLPRIRGLAAEIEASGLDRSLVRLVDAVEPVLAAVDRPAARRGGAR